jgi:hypothetical protein
MIPDMTDTLSKGERLSKETSPTDTLILDFRPLQLLISRNKFLLLKLPSLWYFVMATLANECIAFC